jgi:hypothetical protein
MLPDYGRFVHEQACSSMAELHAAAMTALQQAEFIDDPSQQATQCAIYDSVESEWNQVRMPWYGRLDCV